MPKFQKNKGFTMRSGNKKLPFKLMGSSPAKQSNADHLKAMNDDMMNNINVELEKANKRGRYTFDVETGDIKPPTEGKLSREDKDLGLKYENTLAKANKTKQDIINQQTQKRNKRTQKLNEAKTKKQGLTTQKQNLQSQIEKTTDSDKLKELNKQLKKTQRQENRATRKVERKQKRADKDPKGNLLTRVKSNFQEKSLKNQRRFINMSDDERRSFKQMKAKNIAEMLRTAGPSNYKPEIQHDLNAFMNPDANKLTNTTFSDMYKKAFTEGLKSAQVTTTPKEGEEYDAEYKKTT